MNRKMKIGLLSAAITCLGMFGTASPASASCTEVIDGTGCIESVVCRPLSKIADCVE